MARFRVTDVEALEGEGPGGMVRKVRRALGASAFGVNWFRFPPETKGREHDHAESGQEEVYVVVGGSGLLRVDGEEIELRRGIVVRVAPEATRLPVSGPKGHEYVAIGAPLDGAYEPPDWG